MKIVLLLLIVFHGLIHLLGFTKAFNLAEVNQLNQSISKPYGILWLLSTFLFILTALLLFFNKDLWWMPSAAALLISQILIFTSWQDAKFGTIANFIILLATIIGYGTTHFKNNYENEVTFLLKQTTSNPDTLLTEADIQHLPESVRRYLHYTGVLNKPKVRNFKVEFSGQIRKDNNSDWMPFKSEQYNFIDSSTRLFFMNATMKHLPIAGYHCFKNGTAFMDIRLLSLFNVQYQSGKEMGIAETVTFFNDMCCMAPATLIDKRIKWQQVDQNVVQAEFTNNNITISAKLFFNEIGELVDFISNDRYTLAADNSMVRITWSTPLKDYKIIKGYSLPGYADAIYNYPYGDLCYGNFRLTNIEYNCKEYK